jgi:hypothetical protein
MHTATFFLAGNKDAVVDIVASSVEAVQSAFAVDPALGYRPAMIYTRGGNVFVVACEAYSVLQILANALQDERRSLP